jgi:hypothetical protein
VRTDEVADRGKVLPVVVRDVDRAERCVVVVRGVRGGQRRGLALRAHAEFVGLDALAAELARLARVGGSVVGQESVGRGRRLRRAEEGASLDDVDEAGLDDLDVAAGHVRERGELHVPAVRRCGGGVMSTYAASASSVARTGLTHGAEVGVEAALVVAEGRIRVGVAGDPGADLLAQGRVRGGRAVQLVRERPEQAVAVAQRRRRVQPERAQLRVQLLARVRRVARRRLCAVSSSMYARTGARRTLPRERVVRAGAAGGQRRAAPPPPVATHAEGSAARPASFGTSGAAMCAGELVGTGGGGDGGVAADAGPRCASDQHRIARMGKYASCDHSSSIHRRQKIHAMYNGLDCSNYLRLHPPTKCVRTTCVRMVFECTACGPGFSEQRTLVHLQPAHLQDAAVSPVRARSRSWEW